MSEILCHGLGAHFLFEPDCTVEGVGGQDTKAIKTLNDKPADFIMNDKCFGGHGQIFRDQREPLGTGAKRNLQNCSKKSRDQAKLPCAVFAETVLAKCKRRAIWSQISPSATLKSPVR